MLSVWDDFENYTYWWNLVTNMILRSNLFQTQRLQIRRRKCNTALARQWPHVLDVITAHFLPRPEVTAWERNVIDAERGREAFAL